MSVLVLALYIDSDAAQVLYRLPGALWVLCPLLLLSMAGIWLKAHRGQMDDDPVLFTARDGASLATLTAGGSRDLVPPDDSGRPQRNGVCGQGRGGAAAAQRTNRAPRALDPCRWAPWPSFVTAWLYHNATLNHFYIFGSSTDSLWFAGMLWHGDWLLHGPPGIEPRSYSPRISPRCWSSRRS